MKLATLLVTSLALVGVAHADLSRGVIAAYRGQIVITKEDLPEGKTDKDTITKINAARVKSLDGKVNDDGQRVTLDVKAGDTILFGKYSGQEIKIDGVEYLIMKEDDVLAAIDGPGSAKTSTARTATGKGR